MMAVAVFVMALLLCLQKSITAAQHEAGTEEFDTKASAIMQQTKSQVVILTNQLLTNATVITHAAEGNASLLLANLYNEINKGIADAQAKATQIGNSFQANMTRRADEVMNQAANIYTSVEASLRNTTNRVEETISRLLASTQAEMSRIVEVTRTKLTAVRSGNKSSQPEAAGGSGDKSSQPEAAGGSGDKSSQPEAAGGSGDKPSQPEPQAADSKTTTLAP